MTGDGSTSAGLSSKDCSGGSHRSNWRDGSLASRQRPYRRAPMAWVAPPAPAPRITESPVAPRPADDDDDDEDFPAFFADRRRVRAPSFRRHLSLRRHRPPPPPAAARATSSDPDTRGACSTRRAPGQKRSYSFMGYAAQRANSGRGRAPAALRLADAAQVRGRRGARREVRGGERVGLRVAPGQALGAPAASSASAVGEDLGRTAAGRVLNAHDEQILAARSHRRGSPRHAPSPSPT